MKQIVFVGARVKPQTPTPAEASEIARLVAKDLRGELLSLDEIAWVVERIAEGKLVLHLREPGMSTMRH